jgi:hypothetical protein
MTNETKTAEKPSGKKADYDFGTIEKVTIEAKDLDLAVFACADAMPGGDGRDPTRIPAIT